MYQRTKIAVAVTLAISSMAVFAQEAAPAAEQQPLQRVEVTGSRIRQVDIETAQPVLTMNAEQIQKTGLINVGDILNNLSSSGSPVFSKGAVLTSNREQGGQYSNMRNLGSQRLLVLVNGKRWTQTVAGYTDMSTIPSSLIERIEILKDGASAIYGSDAIAGVVNIILKKSMDGGRFSAYVGQNSSGDGKSEDYNLAYGAGSEKANMMFGLSHSKTGAVWARDREITSYQYGPEHSTAALGTAPWGRIRNISTAGTATGMDKILNHTGTYNEPGVGQASRDPLSYHNYANAADPNDAYNSTRDMMFQSPTQLTTIFTKGTVQLPADIEFNTTAMYAQRSATATVAGYPASSLMQPRNPVYISKDSYYNPYGNQVAGAGNGVDLFFYRRTIEVPRQTVNKNNTFHIDASLSGEFDVAGSPWSWNVGVNHSAFKGSTDNTGNLNLVNLKKALGPSFMNADGVVQCGTPTAPLLLTECVPFDILGGPSASNAQVLDYVMAKSHATYGSTVNSVTADVAGDVFQLPAGGLGIAAGVEKREVVGYDRPDQLDRLALTSSLAGNSTEGSYDVKEAYLEVNVPVLKGMPFAELLSFNVASRYSDYSNFGDTTNSKFSFMYRPIKDVLARGTYAQGFRAPTVGDTFGGGSQSFDSYLDPCDSVNGAAAVDPAVAANCAAAGVPAGFRQRQQSGAFAPAQGAQTPYPFNTGLGNTALTPETAVTKTLGLVYNPSYVPGLSMALDWFDIEVKDRITGVSAGYTLSQCYQYQVQEYCNNITRDPVSGQVTLLSRGNKNLGSVRTKGYDLELSYRMPATAYGKFGVTTQSTYLDSYKIQSTATSSAVEYSGVYPYYRLKSNIVMDWSLGNWSATFGTRISSHIRTSCWSVKNNIECSNPTDRTASGSLGYNMLTTQVYNDLSVGYALPWNGKFVAGVNNVFGKKPRINYSAGASAASVDPDVPLERFFYVRYNQQF